MGGEGREEGHLQTHLPCWQQVTSDLETKLTLMR